MKSKSIIRTEYSLECERSDWSHYTNSGHLSLKSAKAALKIIRRGKMEIFVAYRIFKVEVERRTKVVYESKTKI